ncbi:ArsR/SmtB family transcription factor [Streptomonospora wellingtoniae]|uniref:Metalloregulator ArsR/SmtB family transcription factor n=1 Tax=Streptomonospora wellingtoniae TaxID=3075544 RepID=A0ABU2KN33_9ACTN|nr:metalloregulator ArsR/SmtB family transcription factor [Streptomonospora sp. DSM 45055]MDT0300648.1 metalloregulator ArsR/SmtB family transcription factor [Streptomonospora sp. DSM 45055]
MSDDVVDRREAERYADWFKALADATRIRIVTLLARRGAALSVGEIVAAVDVGQSTVSHHLKALAEAGFVLVEHEGAYSRYRLNEECVEAFPSAADVVMGRPAPVQAGGHSGTGRWGRPR